MTTISDEQKARLAKLFGQIDQDRDGYICETEFAQLLQALGEDMLKETLSLQFAVIDSNDDGVVNFNEFIVWWMDH